MNGISVASRLKLNVSRVCSKQTHCVYEPAITSVSDTFDPVNACILHPPVAHAHAAAPADAAGEPVAGVGRTLLLPHPSGISIGIIGLVEGDWVETLATVEPDAVNYIDFVEEGRRLAQQLRVS